MTRQIRDRLVYQCDEYVILGVRGSGLLSPKDFGMKPVMMHTACYRGYHAEYSCIGERLLLTTMRLRLADDNYKMIDGVHPGRVFITRKGSEIVLAQGNEGKKIDGLLFAHAYEYQELNIATIYSGGLLAGKDFIEKMEVWEQPFSYRTVIELLIEDGKVERVIDHSEGVAQIREALLRNGPPDRWSEIKWDFSLDYDFCYPLNQAFEKEEGGARS